MARPQLRSRSLLGELNTDIWRAYRHAYREGDASAFLAVHSPDLIRAGGPAQTITGFPEYGTLTRQWFADLTERGDSVDIEFRFTERIADGALASERGIYRLTAQRPDHEPKVMYGRFHTFARKTNGRWHIVADYDSDENATVTEADFLSAQTMDEGT